MTGTQFDGAGDRWWTAERTRLRLGPFGVWIAPATLLATPVAVLRAQLRRIEGLGYGSFWTGEPPAADPPAGREIFSLLAVALAAGDRLVVGSGIANVTARGPQATQTGAATLAEAYPDRLVLGLGGASGPRPLTELRAYLDALDETAAHALPGTRLPRVLAALGPRAHELAAERADGVHPFLQPVAHTAFARRALGPGPLVVPHQALTLEREPSVARESIRAIRRMGEARRSGVLNAYSRSYLRLGFGEADLADGGSDALVDAILAHGEPAAVAARLREHHAAGADHVLLHPLTADLPSAVDALERLAPELLG
ncbi:TIGR03620 family F420-dependent LLM class oxidoreductase [Streptomyces sp. 3MP-14]|uniref:TIGR03620 family F420-dependent LLM class oxidoreductase n=1 Tax=Streptomyces mimosae TaxID=2586635 RepID=A0A5N6ANH7_9ACTN|nr:MULTISPECIES: TIGR03620 family F420-dependent LLM class oxidoreductase [Streptomyces]KAB8169775.1 TIGR03620 family F420-dependent LLM class oxidoreductase [Streptomyces mimosae]KAB8178523.1 TIGR03620 family F420-dependent LLM class oxidoreductase [Streptomyces sp. 3MP-14]